MSNTKSCSIQTRAFACAYGISGRVVCSRANVCFARPRSWSSIYIEWLLIVGRSQTTIAQVPHELNDARRALQIFESFIDWFIFVFELCNNFLFEHPCRQCQRARVCINSRANLLNYNNTNKYPNCNSIYLHRSNNSRPPWPPSTRRPRRSCKCTCTSTSSIAVRSVPPRRSSRRSTGRAAHYSPNNQDNHAFWIRGGSQLFSSPPCPTMITTVYSGTCTARRPNDDKRTAARRRRRPCTTTVDRWATRMSQIYVLADAHGRSTTASSWIPWYGQRHSSSGMFKFLFSPDNQGTSPFYFSISPDSQGGSPFSLLWA